MKINLMAIIVSSVLPCAARPADFIQTSQKIRLGKISRIHKVCVSTS